MIYPADHIPAHVHVFGGGNEAVFNLNCPGGPVQLRENYGFSRREFARIRDSLNDAVPMLCEEWQTNPWPSFDEFSCSNAIAANERRATEPNATEAHYDKRRGRIVVSLTQWPGG